MFVQPVAFHIFVKLTELKIHLDFEMYDLL